MNDVWTNWNVLNMMQAGVTEHDIQYDDVWVHVILTHINSVKEIGKKAMALKSVLLVFCTSYVFIKTWVFELIRFMKIKN